MEQHKSITNEQAGSQVSITGWVTTLLLLVLVSCLMNAEHNLCTVLEKYRLFNYQVIWHCRPVSMELGTLLGN